MANLVLAVVVVVALLAFCGNASSSRTQLTERNLTRTTSKAVIIAKKLTNFWDWIKNLVESENSIVGRCFGIAKKLRFVIPLIIFLLGVTVTTLKFLTIFSLKGLGLLTLLLILNVGPIFAKFALLKSSTHDEPPPIPAVPPQTVHFHLHHDDYKPNHYKIAHSGPGFDTGWSDRVSQGLSKTSNPAEKVELLNLYKRLGFKVDSNAANINWN